MTNNRKLTVFICAAAIIFTIIIKILPVIYFSKGKSALERGDYPAACVNLSKAHYLNRKNKDYRYYYVQALSNMTPTVRVQKELYQIANSKEDDSAKNLAMKTVSKLKYSITQGIGDNYIEQVPFNNGILRWDNSSFPLKVAFINKVNAPDYYRTEVMKAFAQWQVSTNYLTFTIVDNPENANIIVSIEATPQDLCQGNVCQYVVGQTTPKINGSRLESMSITIYNKDVYGNYFLDKELYNTVLHEIGHALGIMGHSYNPDDIMYMSTNSDAGYYAPFRSAFQSLTSRDVNTVLLLYKLIPNITNVENPDIKGLIYAPIILGTQKEITNRKIYEAQQYIKNAPELSGGYIDLAIAYADSGKFDDAISNMKKAVSLSKNDNEQYIAYYNLAALYLNTGKYNDALDNAQKAQSISNCAEIQELIANIKKNK